MFAGLWIAALGAGLAVVTFMIAMSLGGATDGYAEKLGPASWVIGAASVAIFAYGLHRAKRGAATEYESEASGER